MNKDFIPYEQALALKELGFDEPCFAFYQKEYAESTPIMVDDNHQYRLTGFRTCRNSEIPEHYVSTPLYQQAFRWLYLKLDIKNGTMPLDKEAQESLLKELIDKLSSKHLLV